MCKQTYPLPHPTAYSPDSIRQQLLQSVSTPSTFRTQEIIPVTISLSYSAEGGLPEVSSSPSRAKKMNQCGSRMSERDGAKGGSQRRRWWKSRGIMARDVGRGEEGFFEDDDGERHGRWIAPGGRQGRW